MTLVEAVRSDRPFRRVSWKQKSYITVGNKYKEAITLTRNEILANDWEVKETVVSITRTQFFNAMAKVAKSIAQQKSFVLPPNFSEAVYTFEGSQELARELGLDEP